MVYDRQAALRLIGKMRDETERVLAGEIEGGLELDSKVKSALKVTRWSLWLAEATLRATMPGGDIATIDWVKERLAVAITSMRCFGP